jgi:hypothetical protein
VVAVSSTGATTDAATNAERVPLQVRQAAERRDCKVEAASSPVLVSFGRASGLVLVLERGAHTSVPNELNVVWACGCSGSCTALRRASRASLSDDERREARVTGRGSDACHHRNGRARDVRTEGEVRRIEDDAGSCIAETCDGHGAVVSSHDFCCCGECTSTWLPRLPWGVVGRTGGPVDASEHEEDEMQLVRREEDRIVVPAEAPG